jgi:hypothetical protein
LVKNYYNAKDLHGNQIQFEEVMMQGKENEYIAP